MGITSRTTPPLGEDLPEGIDLGAAAGLGGAQGFFGLFQNQPGLLLGSFLELRALKILRIVDVSDAGRNADIPRAGA